MSIKLNKINNMIVKPIPAKLIGKGEDNRPVLGADMFKDPYNNIFIVAHKKSGKTTTIFNIIKHTINKNCHVIVFCSTVNKDDSYKAIKNYCKKHDIPYNAYLSFLDGDILENLIDELEKQIEDDENDDDNKQHDKFIMYGNGLDEDEVKEKKDKYKVPEYLFIFDDLGRTLRHKMISTLLKKNRHFKSRCIISTQYLNDLQPESLRQIDNWVIFPGNVTKLEEIYGASDIAGIFVNCDNDKDKFEQFKEIYKNATAEKYNFLYVDCRFFELRKNFNERYEICEK